MRFQDARLSIASARVFHRPKKRHLTMEILSPYLFHSTSHLGNTHTHTYTQALHFLLEFQVTFRIAASLLRVLRRALNVPRILKKMGPGILYGNQKLAQEQESFLRLPGK